MDAEENRDDLDEMTIKIEDEENIIAQDKTAEPLEIVFMDTLKEPIKDSDLEEDVLEDPLSINIEEYAKTLVNSKQEQKIELSDEDEESKDEECIKCVEDIIESDTKMGPPCTCRLHCSDRVDEKERKELNRVFWNIFTQQQRRQYVALSIKEYLKDNSRWRPHTTKRRTNYWYTFFLLLKGEYIPVCRNMFASTFAVSKKFLQEMIDEKRLASNNFITLDERDKHAPKRRKSENERENKGLSV